MSVFEMEGIDDRYVSMIFATECKKVRSRRGKERARFGLYILLWHLESVSGLVCTGPACKLVCNCWTRLTRSATLANATHVLALPLARVAAL